MSSNHYRYDTVEQISKTIFVSAQEQKPGQTCTSLEDGYAFLCGIAFLKQLFQHGLVIF